MRYADVRRPVHRRAHPGWARATVVACALASALVAVPGSTATASSATGTTAEAELPATASPSARTAVSGRWRITAYDFGTLGGNRSEPFDVNARGLVTGVSVDADGVSRPVFGVPGRGLRAVPGASDDLQPEDLSDAGAIAGVVFRGGMSVAALWATGRQTLPDGETERGAGVAVREDGVALYNRLRWLGCGSNCSVVVPTECRTLDLTAPGSASQPLPPPPSGSWGDWHGCIDVSRRGTILGAMGLPPTQGFLVREGNTTLLPSSARGATVRLHGITDADDVLAEVGVTVPNEDGSARYTTRALRLVNGAWAELPLPAGSVELDASLPTRGEHAGNGRHDMIGQYSRDGSGVRQPVVWRGGTTPVLLPHLGQGGEAAAINERGDVVGSVYSPEGPYRATLWRGGERIDLSAVLGDTGQPSTAKWITDSGLIVGTRLTNSGQRIMAWSVTPA
jgi:uncharacterized membrane protein